MKKYKRIDFRKAAEKFLKSRSRKEQVWLLTKISKLPDGEHIKKMETYDNRYRLRVGDYRVIYDVTNEIDTEGDDDQPKEILVILIVEIGNRGDIYK